MLRLVTAFALLVALPSLAPANCLVASDNGTATSVYFSNGMSGDETGAQLNRGGLERAYKSVLEARYPGSTFRFRLAYNTGDGAGDLVEVVRDKFGELQLTEGERGGLTPTQTLQLLLAGVSDAWITRIWRAITGSTRGITSSQIEEIRRALADRWRQEPARRAYRGHHLRVWDEDTHSAPSAHVLNFEADLQGGQRVIVVAHSQGNFFANKAVQEVTGRQPQCAESIVVSVATPASRLANGGSRYVTAKDYVVSQLHSLVLFGSFCPEMQQSHCTRRSRSSRSRPQR